MEKLKQPYEYSREEFNNLINELKPNGACSSQKYNGKIDWGLVRHLERVEYMSYGVHKWLYEKAMNGCKESLWKLEYHYDLYTEVLNKKGGEKMNAKDKHARKARKRN